MTFARKLKEPFVWLGLIFIIGSSHGACALDTNSSSIVKLVSGNSLKVTNKYGHSLIHFDSDGRLTHLNQDGLKSSEGTWRVSENNICTTVTSLPPGRVAHENCLDVSGQTFNKMWSSEDPRNGKIEYQFFQGRPNISDIGLRP